jgi:hypothetical protein
MTVKRTPHNKAHLAALVAKSADTSAEAIRMAGEAKEIHRKAAAMRNDVIRQRADATKKGNV